MTIIWIFESTLSYFLVNNISFPIFFAKWNIHASVPFRVRERETRKIDTLHVSYIVFYRSGHGFWIICYLWINISALRHSDQYISVRALFNFPCVSQDFIGMVNPYFRRNAIWGTCVLLTYSIHRHKFQQPLVKCRCVTAKAYEWRKETSECQISQSWSF